MHFAANAIRSLVSSITMAVGFPAPWPARTSMRDSSGLRCALPPGRSTFASTCCSVAVSLCECSGTTRSSWSPVAISIAGYCPAPPAGGRTLCSGLYGKMYSNSSARSGFPKSVHHAWPIVNLWKRSMSITPTWASTHAYRSGRWFAHAATSRPPLEPPWMVSVDGEQNLPAWRCSAHAWKSSNTFCLFCLEPASLHVRPYSLPPRRQA
mmetsp:Transcript_9872/g.29839  ORF Transcript_9872/g.29839 Transcript_9872/m.29839 type:complete len:209 (-) Transcript_9872:2124-2750(-)